MCMLCQLCQLGGASLLLPGARGGEEALARMSAAEGRLAAGGGCCLCWQPWGTGGAACAGSLGGKQGRAAQVRVAKGCAPGQ